MKTAIIFTILAASMLAVTAKADPITCEGSGYTVTLNPEHRSIAVHGPQIGLEYLVGSATPIEGGTRYTATAFASSPYHTIVLSVFGGEAELKLAGKLIALDCQ